jgi:hypothetical protein
MNNDDFRLLAVQHALDALKALAALAVDPAAAATGQHAAKIGGYCTRSCTLFSFEPSQEPKKCFRTGSFGAWFRRVLTTSQSDRKWLAIAINLPSPAPRIWVWLLHYDIVSSGLHATILRHSSIGRARNAIAAGHRPVESSQCRGTVRSVAQWRRPANANPSLPYRRAGMPVTGPFHRGSWTKAPDDESTANADSCQIRGPGSRSFVSRRCKPATRVIFAVLLG